MNLSLVRNDLGVICDEGSITVPKITRVENSTTACKMVSTACSNIKTANMNYIIILNDIFQVIA